MAGCGPYDIDSSSGSSDYTARGEGDARCPRDWQVLKLQQGLPQLLTVTVEDSTLDSLAVTAGQRVRLFIREHHDSDVNVAIVQGTRADDNARRVFQFDFNEADLVNVGLLLGEIIIYEEVDGGNLADDDIAGVPDPTSDDDTSEYRPVYIHRVFVEVAVSVGLDCGASPLTISELRLALRDECAMSNFILDDVEFTNKEIVDAIHQVVNYWNEVPPDVKCFNYNNFPSRYFWKTGAMGLLLRQTGRHKLRNWLPYTGGGLAMNDNSIWDSYHRLGDQYWNEYREWVQRKKIEINIAGAFMGFRGGVTY